MPDESHAEAWVFHAGALGDFILLWPLIRALARRRPRVHVVADSEKASLAAAWIEPGAAITPHDTQRREFTRLWTGASDPASVQPGARLVVNAVADPDAPAGAAWLAGAAGMFPAAEFVHVGVPGSRSRAAAWRELRIGEHGSVERRWNVGGAIVCHVGAGAASKRWPLQRWRELMIMLRARNIPTRVLAGEVEAERFTPDEHRDFQSLGGELCTSLRSLAETIAAARAFVGADTGPTHLAAQLGVPTLALFGPTDPSIWAPVGPSVTVVAPREPASMDWLASDDVATALARLIM